MAEALGNGVGVLGTTMESQNTEIGRANDAEIV